MSKVQNWTPDQYKNYLQKKHSSKMKNEIVEGGTLFTEMAGRSFASKLERRVGTILCARLHAGEIEDLRFQDAVHLSDADISWRVDFSYIELEEPFPGQRVWHEAKGQESEGYGIKLRLFMVYGPGPLRITKAGVGGNLTEKVIIPKPLSHPRGASSVKG